jgi:hypothetical protein
VTFNPNILTRRERDGLRMQAIEAIPMADAAYWTEWHERLIMRRESPADVLRKYRASMSRAVAKLVKLGLDRDEARLRVEQQANQSFIASLQEAASNGQQSRRDYEADRLDVTLRREREPSKRGANGRSRARCVNQDTGRETSPAAFTGGARFIAAQSRAAGRDGICHYRVVRDDCGVWLRTVLEATRGLYHQYDAPELDAADIGVLLSLADQFCAKGPGSPEAVAARHEERDFERKAAESDRRRTVEWAERRAAELAAEERRLARAVGSKRRRGSRGRGRGRGSRAAKRLLAAEAVKPKRTIP